MDANTAAAVAAWAACASAGTTAITVGVTAWFARKQVAAAQDQVKAALQARSQQERQAQQALAAQAQVAHATLEHEAREAQKTREEQSQPNVVIFIEPNSAVSYALELVVKNFGATPAYDVRLKFDPEPQVSPHSIGDTEIAELWYPELIPILAPMQEWRTLWDVSHKRFELDTLPSRHEASATYTDSSGKPFMTESVLDWESLRGTEMLVIQTVHNVAKLLEAQNKVLQSISNNVAALSSSTQGVWAFTADAKLEAEAREAAEEARRQSMAGLRRQLAPNESTGAATSTGEPPEETAQE
ncbi:hypothetical protein ACFV24_34390 [Nocardia fluminea]|uniref:hypothetical protein n=1 Tax=Nocardia fluminea TaxID=134984 RepID=UPI003672FFC9